MKNLDIILATSCLVVGFVVVLILWSTKRTPVMAPSVPKINTAPVQLPPVQIAMTNGLPGGGGGGMAAGGGKGKVGFRG
jgi:hypothetical protein